MWGPGKEMMKAYEKNRAQLNRRESLKEKTDFGKKNSTPINTKKVSSQELEEIKQKILHKRRNENQKNLLILLFIIISIMVLSNLFF
ncbi:MAG: hypothetical protein ACPGVD_06920 [Flavobacteriales bacterium]